MRRIRENSEGSKISLRKYKKKKKKKKRRRKLRSKRDRIREDKTMSTQSRHFYFILSSAQYWLRSTDHEAPQYEVFSTPLLPRPSWTQIFYSTTYLCLPYSKNISSGIKGCVLFVSSKVHRIVLIAITLWPAIGTELRVSITVDQNVITR
jgi:hypothetical protein